MQVLTQVLNTVAHRNATTVAAMAFTLAAHVAACNGDGQLHTDLTDDTDRTTGAAVDLTGRWTLPPRQRTYLLGEVVEGGNVAAGFGDAPYVFEADGEPACPRSSWFPHSITSQLVFSPAGTLAYQARFYAEDCTGKSGWIRISAEAGDWAFVERDPPADLYVVSGQQWRIEPLDTDTVSGEISSLDEFPTFSLTRLGGFEP